MYYVYFSWLWLSPLRGWGSLTMVFTGKFVYIAHRFILLWFNCFGLNREGWWFVLIWRDGGLSTLCHSSGFNYHQRLLKTFPGPGYLGFEE